ncbi:MAG: DUF502 domain-containing protein [Candidatus Omnitrophica bacterium]|nr:DUF502 domain-containing protein [Candidatus Omnitrophota bacterium]
MKTRLWNKLLISFLNGMVVILPVMITVLIIQFIVQKLNDIVLTPLLNIFAPMGRQVDHVYLAKAVILAGVIIMVAFIGWGAKILVINRFFSYWESLLIRLPILGRVYRSVKQISSAFIGQGKTVFKQVVLIEYPRKGLYSLGFTTGTARGEVKDAMRKNGVTVFVPTSPNPTSGMMIIVSREEIRFLDMTVEEGMKMVISGGSVQPDIAGL